MAASGSDGFVSPLLLGSCLERLTQKQENFLTLLQECDDAWMLKPDDASIDLDKIKLSFYKSVFELFSLYRESHKDTKQVLPRISRSWLRLFNVVLKEFENQEGNQEEKSLIHDIRKLIKKKLKPKCIHKWPFPKENSGFERATVQVEGLKMGAECLDDVLNDKSISFRLRKILLAIKEHDSTPDVFKILPCQTRMVLGLIKLVDPKNEESLTRAKKVLECMKVSSLSFLKEVISVFENYYLGAPLYYQCLPGTWTSFLKCSGLLRLIKDSYATRKGEVSRL